MAVIIYNYNHTFLKCHIFYPVIWEFHDETYPETWIIMLVIFAFALYMLHILLTNCSALPTANMISMSWACCLCGNIYDWSAHLYIHSSIYWLGHSFFCSLIHWLIEWMIDWLVAFIINNPMNPICLNSFTIKSSSAPLHLRKIWLHGQIFIFYKPHPWDKM